MRIGLVFSLLPAAACQVWVGEFQQSHRLDGAGHDGDVGPGGEGGGDLPVCPAVSIDIHPLEPARAGQSAGLGATISGLPVGVEVLVLIDWGDSNTTRHVHDEVTESVLALVDDHVYALPGAYAIRFEVLVDHQCGSWASDTLLVCRADWMDLAAPFRQVVSIQSSQVVDTLAGFPVLVSWPLPAFCLKANCAELRIFSPTGPSPDALPWEVELATDPLVLWVRVPLLSNSVNTVLHFYYGGDTSISEPVAAEVWSNGFVGVWHLSDPITDSSPVFHDATGNLDGVGVDEGAYDKFDETDRVPGQIGMGVSFSTELSRRIEVYNDTALDLVEAITLSAWVKPNAIDNTVSRFAVRRESGYFLHYSRDDWTTKPAFYAFLSGDYNWQAVNSTDALDVGVWSQLVGTYDASNGVLRLFVNGIRVNEGSYPFPFPTLDPFSPDPGDLVFPRQADGVLDEVRLVSEARSEAWIQTAYRNQQNPGAFVLPGITEQRDEVP